jgi:arylsulfatase A-like enzyme
LLVESEGRATGVAGWLLATLPVVLVTSALLGTIRGLGLFARGDLPLHALPVAIGFNTFTGLLPGLLLTPLVVALCWLLGRAGLRAPSVRSALLPAAAVFAAFWALHTTALDGALLRGGLSGAIRHLSVWLPILVVAACVAAWLGAARSIAGTWRRAAWALVAFALLYLPLVGYAVARNPSSAPPLERSASASHHPPVFVVLVDTLRADHLSSYGYPHPTSPAIDRLGEEGARFTRTFAQAPWTRPSCTSLLTGRYPPDVGMRSMRNPLPGAAVILPQLLQAEGYATAGIISSIQVSREFGFDKGFDHLDNGSSYLRWAGSHHALVRLGLMPEGHWYPRYHAAELTDEAIEWIDRQRRRDAPIFMYLHYSDPHEPYEPPAGEDRWREFASERARALAQPPPRSPKGDQVFSETEIEALVARYDAEIAYVDREIGRLLDHLRASGLYDDALVVLTSDHGEEFSEHGLWTHAKTLYNEVLHIPLVVKYPQRLAHANGRTIDAPSALVDIAPTIADVLGADWSDLPMRGRSLLSLVDAPPERLIYADNERPALRAVIDPNVKLLQVLDDAGEVQEERLYSLRHDFAERSPTEPTEELASPDLAERRGLAAAVFRQHAGEEIELDKETRQELRALGYSVD